MSSQYTGRGTDAVALQGSTDAQDTLSTPLPYPGEGQSTPDTEQRRVQEDHHPASVILRHDTDSTTNVDVVVYRTGCPPKVTVTLSLPLDGINFETAAAVASLPDLTTLILNPSILHDPYANLDTEPLLGMLSSLSSLSSVSLCVDSLLPNDTEQVLDRLRRLPTVNALEMVLSPETAHGVSNQRSLMTLTLEVCLIRGIEFFLQLSNVSIPASLLTELVQGALGRLPNLRRLCITSSEDDDDLFVSCELGCTIASHVFSENLQQCSPLDRPFASLDFLDLGGGANWHEGHIKRYLPHVTIV